MKKKIGKSFLSLFYAGYFPKAPGTFGSLISLFILYLFKAQIYDFQINYKIFILITCFVIIYITSLFLIPICTHKKNVDQQWIVIDEFLGMFIAFLPIFFINSSNTIILSIISFILFRFFDILKPLGIKKIDRSHTANSVLLDDVIAGIYSLIIILFLSIFIVS